MREVFENVVVEVIEISSSTDIITQSGGGEQDI